MKTAASSRRNALDALWAHHHGEFRDPGGVAVSWHPPSEVDPALLAYRIRGDFWGAVRRAGSTLLVTREYEHLVMALAMVHGRPRLSYLRLPHPNGIAVDTREKRVHIASTRNPNVVFEFAPVRSFLRRAGTRVVPADLARTLIPVRSRMLPGSLYVHDLALVGGRLHANAVGLNAVIDLSEPDGFRTVWWPRCIDAAGGPRFDRNYLQLNSIAAGHDLASSYFAASAARPSSRRPGHLNFQVDGRGVIFSGRTREVVATGLTRPHSARLSGGELWVDNSGYGQVGRIVRGRFEPAVELRGWTRGLCIRNGLAFVGTSRVIPRFRSYAPGLDCDRTEAGVHAVDLDTGRILGSLIWPTGNQVFGVALSGFATVGFPAGIGERAEGLQRRLFSAGLATANAELPIRARPAVRPRARPGAR